MRRIFAAWVAAVVLVTASAVCAQSLGDVARETRQKEKSKGAGKKKIITNEDLPATPDLTPGQQETIGKLEPTEAASAPADKHSAEEWKSLILAQKIRIATLQTQLDKLSASIRFVEANAYVNGAQYNQYQARKQQQVANMKTLVAEQKQKLEEMQDAAKKAGMGSAVYDP